MRRLVAVLIAVAAICWLTIPGLLLLPAPASGVTPAWQKTSLDAGQVHAVLVHPTDPATVFAGTDRGLFRSTDLGATWGPYGTGIKTSSSTTLQGAGPCQRPADGSRTVRGNLRRSVPVDRRRRNVVAGFGNALGQRDNPLLLRDYGAGGRPCQSTDHLCRRQRHDDRGTRPEVHGRRGDLDDSRIGDLHSQREGAGHPSGQTLDGLCGGRGLAVRFG